MIWFIVIFLMVEYAAEKQKVGQEKQRADTEKQDLVKFCQCPLLNDFYAKWFLIGSCTSNIVPVPTTDFTSILPL